MSKLPNPLRILRRKSARAALPDPESKLEKPDEGHELQMGFFEHLGELRERLFKAMFGVIVGTVIGLFLSAPMLEVLQGPYCQIRAPESCEFQILDPTGSIIVYLRVALLIGGILAIPLITYQLLMFIMPGLTRKERRFFLWSLPAITGLFLIGALFAWRILMPPALGFLEGFQPTIFKPEWTADGYLSFVTSLVFWMGVAFETPLVFFLMSLLGLVSAGPLLKNWRVAIVGASVAAALITPTIDPVNMFLVMGPLMALYLLSIILVVIGRRISGVS